MRTFQIPTLVLIAAALAACGGSTEPHPGATSIVVTPATAAILVGQAQQYTATAVDADGQPIADATFSWKSSTTGVAAISTDGLAQGAAPGATTITASWNGVTSDPATLVVSAGQVAAIHVTPASATIKVGDTQSFSAVAVDANGAPIPGVTFTWASSASSVATIGGDGVAHGAAAGTTAITASAGNVTSDAASLTVTPDVSAACEGIDTVTTWSGSLHFSYAHTASNGHTQIDADEQANVTFDLQLLASGPGGVSWQGVATGTASLDDKQTDLDAAPPAVSSLSGSGAPLPGSEGNEMSRVTLNVDLSNCTYNVEFTPTINATATSGSSSTDMPAAVGAVRSGVYSTSGYSGGLSGNSAMPAHSVIWGAQNEGEEFVPLGLGQNMFLLGLEQDGNAGTADVSWTFTLGK